MKQAVTASMMMIAALCAAPSSAHHSFALYDLSRLTTLNGTVREWTWGNPHTWLVVDVVRQNGKTEQWALAGSSPNMMARWGWKAADIKVGDKVTVDINPARDGQHGGAMKHVFLANGNVLVDPAGQPGKALATGPTSVPTKPQGEVYK